MKIMMKRKPLNRLLKENIIRYGMVLNSTMFINNVLRVKGTKYCSAKLVICRQRDESSAYVAFHYIPFVFIDEIGAKYDVINLSHSVSNLYQPQVKLKSDLMRGIIKNQNVEHMDLVTQQIPGLPKAIIPNQ